MDINDIQFDSLKAYVEKWINKGRSWDEVKTLTHRPKKSAEDLLEDILDEEYDGELQFDLVLWEKFVSLIEESKSDRKDLSMSEGRVLNNVDHIPMAEGTSWNTYKKKLEANPNFSREAIEEIEESSYAILKNLTDTQNGLDSTKGLVIGNVQSGKTANMVGLIAMAADWGWNYFIVLSGTIENLRVQTSKRLIRDLSSDGVTNVSWMPLEKPSATTDVDSLHFGSNDKQRYLTVLLKQSNNLTKLSQFLTKNKQSKIKQLKILIIDDEADQASINTKKAHDEKTKIYDLITSIVHYKNVKAMNYVSYTATPYANVLNDTSKDSLYPRDFIEVLRPSGDYIGPKEIFGIREPETLPSINIVREVPESESEELDLYSKGKEAYEDISSSMKRALLWYVICVAGIRGQNAYSGPISMMIHTSFKQFIHKVTAEYVADFLFGIRRNLDDYLPIMKDMYLLETEKFTREMFFEGMPAYNNSDKVSHYPSWKLIEEGIRHLMSLDNKNYVGKIATNDLGRREYIEGFHIVVDNSAESEEVRLVYPESGSSKQAAFIIIGGNTLSRGLTLEGLTTTYFVRTTNQADTLMQMGRWFGYRKGYELFPRVWMDRKAKDRYELVSQINENLRDEIRVYGKRGFTPSSYAPRIDNSPDYKLLKVTSTNKMTDAQLTEIDFIGYGQQETVFSTNDDVHMQKLALTTDFLNSIGQPRAVAKGNGSVKSNLVWQDVSEDKIRSFLSEYPLSGKQKLMKNLDALLEWITEMASEGSYNHWSVILATKGGLPIYQAGDKWNICGYNPNSVIRNKLKAASTVEYANIKVLRSQGDLLLDIDQLTEKEAKENSNANMIAIREKYGKGNVPVLLLYRIDGGAEGKEVSSERTQLGFEHDTIGINIFIPGFSDHKTGAKKLQAKLDIELDENDDDQVNEEDYRDNEGA